MKIQEFQYPNGWYMRIGQVYSSPYEPYHVRITNITCEEDDYSKEGCYVVHYIKINPKNYDDIWDSEEEHAYVWWFNEGYWDLEKEPDTINSEHGSTITMLSVGNNIKREQNKYIFGFDKAKE